MRYLLFFNSFIFDLNIDLLLLLLNKSNSMLQENYFEHIQLLLNVHLFQGLFVAQASDISVQLNP